MQCSKNNSISKHLEHPNFQSRCGNKNILITKYGTLYMTTGGSMSMPYSQSVGVFCKLEDVKLISGSIQWLTRSQCDVWHVMSLARRSTEGILDVVSEQTKHTGIPFLCYEDLLICPGIRDARHQSFSASTQPSQTWHAQPKRTGEKQTHICQSPLNLPDRATTISLNTPDRATTISLNPPDRTTTISRLIINGMNDRQIFDC